MKSTNTFKRPSRCLDVIVGTILLVVPFHAFLTVWASSGVDHYTALRLWKEFLLIIAIVICGYLLWAEPKLRQQLFSSKLVRLIGVYTAVLLAWGAVAYAMQDANAKALGYGLLVDLRFLAFFIVALVAASCSGKLLEKWQLLLLGPAATVAAVGLAQRLFLPYDYLKHFGYSSKTIFPYETVNHNIHYIRVMSTLRGANPLGAYLTLVVSAAVVLLMKLKNNKISVLTIGVASAAALTLSYSRSAWIGAFISILIIIWVSLKNHQLKRYFSYGLAAFVVVATLLAVGLRHNTAFEDAFLHTDHKSQAVMSSNQGHTAAFKDGLHDITHQPLGKGPGTAGPASVYNNHPSRIAENYFLQVGQETGVIGMVLFIAIIVLIGQELWKKRSEPLALALFASLIGLTLVNLLSHAWTDDTLAYVWWGLAGIALAPTLLPRKNSKI